MSDTTQNEAADLRREVAQLKQQLLAASRLATLGTMAASVAHEFNNILVPVVGYAQMAEKSLATPNPDLALVQKAVSKSASGGEKCGRICQAMLGFARQPSAVSGSATLDGVVDETLAILGRDPSKDGIRLEVDVPQGITARIDPVHAEQVLINLVLNARQAILRARASTGRGRGTISVIGRRLANHVELVVTDTGPGIPTELHEKVFEPFFSTGSTTAQGGTGGGTGLGLSICRQIIEGAGGTITLTSAPGMGCQFRILLPPAASERAVAA